MGSGGAEAVQEAAGRCVQVEEADRLRPGVAEAVHRPGRRGDERPRPGDTRLVSDVELNLALEDVEAVGVVWVRVRVDALELGTERHLDRGELRQVAEDPVRARLVLERLGLIAPGEDGVREGPATVRRWLVLVEAGVLAAAKLVAEAAGRRVHVEEDRGCRARIAEGVDGVRRGGREGARACDENRALGAEHELDLTLEDVERVGVVVVNVRLGPLLAGLVPKPRHDHRLEVGEDPQRPLGPVRGRLALAGR